MEPLVDIVLSTYDGAVHLEAQLASLRAQRHQNWRLIARDDGSSDATAAILATFAADDVRVVILPAGGSASGPVAAFGAALAHSDAPYFMFCDQDDVWLPQKITAMLSKMIAEEHHDQPCLVHSDMRVVDETLSEIAPSFWARQNLTVEGITVGPLLLRNVVTGCAMMGNAALRDAMTPIPEAAIMHDWWAALVATQLGQVIAVPEPLLLYRRHERNVTGFEEHMWAAEMVRAVRAGLSQQRTYLAALQAQARALAPVARDSVVAEFGELAGKGLLERKSFLARRGLIRWDEPLRSLAYHLVI